MTKDEAMKLALDALIANVVGTSGRMPKTHDAITALREALDEPSQQADANLVQESVLENIEQYRLQMAGISTAAIGYWKEGDSIHPDYDTPALRDVAKLYAKYAALYRDSPRREWVSLTDEDHRWVKNMYGQASIDVVGRAYEQRLKEKNHG